MLEFDAGKRVGAIERGPGCPAVLGFEVGRRAVAGVALSCRKETVWYDTCYKNKIVIKRSMTYRVICPL